MFFVSLFSFLLISTFIALGASPSLACTVSNCAIWDFLGGLHTWSSFVHGLQVFEKVQTLYTAVGSGL